MSQNIFGFQKDERVDNEWQKLVGRLEESGWQRESFTTLYEARNLFIPDAPEAEMSFETKDLIFNITAFLTERKLYFSIAPSPAFGQEGQLSLVTCYHDDLDLWLDTISEIPNSIKSDAIPRSLQTLVRLFPRTCLELPVGDERICVPFHDPIAQKLLEKPFCHKDPCIESLLDPLELQRLEKMARNDSPWQ